MNDFLVITPYKHTPIVLTAYSSKWLGIKEKILFAFVLSLHTAVSLIGLEFDQVDSRLLNY